MYILPACFGATFPPDMMEALLGIVVLGGGSAVRIFRSYFSGVCPTHVCGRQGRQKNLVFPWIFQFLGLSPAVFATALLWVRFWLWVFPKRTSFFADRVVFSVFWRYPAFRFLTFSPRLCFTWRVVRFCCWKIFRSLGLPVFFSVLGIP